MPTRNLEDGKEVVVEETSILNTETPVSSDLNVDTASDRELFQATLREQYKKNRELQDELARVKAEKEKPIDEDPWKTFTESPDDVISKRVAEQVKPLQEFVFGMKRERDFERVLSPFKKHTVYKQVIEKVGESQIYEAMNNTEINTNTVQMALDLIFAAIQTGRLANVEPIGTGTSKKEVPNSKEKEVPPTISPSVSSINRGPTPNKDEPWKNLSESELAFARRNGMSAKEFWESMNEEILIVKPEGK